MEMQWSKVECHAVSVIRYIISHNDTLITSHLNHHYVIFTTLSSILLTRTITARSQLTGPEKDKLKDMISSAEDWLYGDGFDSTKHQYGTFSSHTRTQSSLLTLLLSILHSHYERGSVNIDTHINHMLPSSPSAIPSSSPPPLSHIPTLFPLLLVARKIEELKALSDPIESRLNEDQQRGAHIR